MALRFRQAVSRLQSCKAMAASVRNLSDAAEPDVLINQQGNVGFVALNRPKKLNTLNLNIVKDINPALLAWEKDQNIEAMIVHGMPWGGKAFCAGGDVRAVYDEGLSGGEEHGKGIHGLLTAEFFRQEYQMNHLISTFPHPQIALWDGIVMGGGVGLTAHGMFTVATERTMFAMPETAIGLFPDVGMTHMLPRLRRVEDNLEHDASPVGMYIGLTGVRLKAHDLTFSGLATHKMESSALKELTEAVVNADSRTPQSLDDLLSSFEEKFTISSEEACHIERYHSAILRCFSGDSVEEIIAKLEEETEEAEWAQKNLKMLKGHSPTSMKVTFRMLKEHAHKSFEDSLRMEYRVAQRFMRPKSDFYEGIRAVLVDRNDPPARWAPTTLEEVTDSMVDEFFAPLPSDENELKYLK